LIIQLLKGSLNSQAIQPEDLNNDEIQSQKKSSRFLRTVNL